jgi:hypothetical protein
MKSGPKGPFRNIDARFDALVIPEPMSGCFLWIGWCTPFGHGQFYVGPELYEYAHRYAWRRSNGPIPPGLWVLHNCDNPPCVNTYHLYLGTQVENMRDSVVRGRHRGGYTAGSRVVSEETCKRISEAKKEGFLRRRVELAVETVIPVVAT